MCPWDCVQGMGREGKPRQGHRTGEFEGWIGMCTMNGKGQKGRDGIQVGLREVRVSKGQGLGAHRNKVQKIKGTIEATLAVLDHKTGQLCGTGKHYSLSRPRGGTFDKVCCALSDFALNF